MSALLHCPEIACWPALVAATLPPDQRERCERHLESCTACQEHLDRAEEEGEPLLRLAREIGDPTAVAADPTLSQILDRLHDFKSPVRTCWPEPADLYFLRPAEQPAL